MEYVGIWIEFPLSIFLLYNKIILWYVNYTSYWIFTFCPLFDHVVDFPTDFCGADLPDSWVETSHYTCGVRWGKSCWISIDSQWLTGVHLHQSCHLHKLLQLKAEQINKMTTIFTQNDHFSQTWPLWLKKVNLLSYFCLILRSKEEKKSNSIKTKSQVTWLLWIDTQWSSITALCRSPIRGGRLCLQYARFVPTRFQNAPSEL